MVYFQWLDRFATTTGSTTAAGRSTGHSVTSCKAPKSSSLPKEAIMTVWWDYFFQWNSYQSEQMKEKESISYILQCWNFKNKIGRISFFTWHECFWRFKHKPFPKKFTNSNFTRWCDSWTISGCVTTTTSESPDSFRSLKTIPTSFRSTSRERRTLSSWAKRFVSSFEVFLAKIRRNFSRLWRSTFGSELSTWTTKEINFEKWAGSIV